VARCHITLERLNELDVTRDCGNLLQCSFESVVRGDRARVESNGQRNVHRVVHGSPLPSLERLAQ
jgi:hypothetical protein